MHVADGHVTSTDHAEQLAHLCTLQIMRKLAQSIQSICTAAAVSTRTVHFGAVQCSFSEQEWPIRLGIEMQGRVGWARHATWVRDNHRREGKEEFMPSQNASRGRPHPCTEIFWDQLLRFTSLHTLLHSNTCHLCPLRRPRPHDVPSRPSTAARARTTRTALHLTTLQPDTPHVRTSINRTQHACRLCA